MADQSPIFVKTEVFIVWVLEHTQKFPKHERFRLAKRIEDQLFAFHAALTAAALGRNTHQHLMQADIELAKFRAYFRLSLEMKYTSAGQFGYAAQQVTEIGKLLGGWLKTVVA